MKKILIHVFLDDISKIRTDIENWDKYGASEALSQDLPQFSASNFVAPTAGRVARFGSYAWRVSVPTQAEFTQYQLKDFPSILFIDKNKVVGRVDGTPKQKGDIAKVLKPILGGGTKKMTAGLGLAALFLLGLKMKKKPYTESLIKKRKKRAYKI